MKDTGEAQIALVRNGKHTTEFLLVDLAELNIKLLSELAYWCVILPMATSNIGFSVQIQHPFGSGHESSSQDQSVQTQIREIPIPSVATHHCQTTSLVTHSPSGNDTIETNVDTIIEVAASFSLLPNCPAKTKDAMAVGVAR